MPYYPPSGAGAVNFSAGTTSNNLTAITFSNSNGVSFGLNGSTMTASVVPSAGSLNFSAGTTSGNVTALTFADSNGVSFGLNAGTVTATIQTNYLTTAALSGDTTKYVQAWQLTGNTAGTTSSLQGTKLYFSGGNSITVSGSSNTIVLSVGNYLTTAALSQDSSKYAGTGFTSAGNNIGLSGTLNTAGLSLSATVAAQSNQSAIKAFGVSNTGQTAGNTGVSTGIDWVMAGSNSITLSQSTAAGGPNTVWIQHPAWITTADLSQNSSKYAQAWDLTGNTAGTTSSLQGTAWHFSGGANLTISGSSNTLVFSAGSAAAAPVNFSAGTTSNNLGSVVFSNSNGVSWGLSGSTITGTVSTYSTVGTATTVYDVASASSNGTVTRWAAEDHRHAGIGAIGISTGNTLGTSGSKQGTYWFEASGGVSVSQITSNNGSFTIRYSDNPVGFNGFLEPYPLMTATQTLAPTAGSWYLAPFTAFGSVSGGRVNFLAVNTGTANLFQDIGETAYASSKTGTVNQSYTFSGAMAIFSQGTGTNSTRLESVWSNSHSWGWSKVINISTNAATNIAVSLAHSISYQSEIGSDGAYTNVQYANAGSSTIANSSGNSTALSTVFSSGRNLISGSLVQPFGFSTTLTAGVYWMGYAWSSTQNSASTGGLLVSGPNFGFSGLLGMSRLAVDSLYRNFGSTATTARSQLIPYGVYTGAANMAPPSAIALSSDLSSLASQWVPYFNWNARGLTK